MITFKEEVEQKIRVTIGDDKSIIDGYVSEDEATHILIVEGNEVRVMETETSFEWQSDICEYCGGIGELSSMMTVYAGEPHMADIGTEPCICQIQRDEE